MESANNKLESATTALLIKLISSGGSWQPKFFVHVVVHCGGGGGGALHADQELEVAYIIYKIPQSILNQL